MLLVGCAEEEPEQAAPEVDPEEAETVEVRAVEIGPFRDVPEEVPAGPVTFVLENEDPEEPHDFNVEELGRGTDVIGPGETDEVTVELEAGTTYTYYCSVPGHRQAGMEGTLQTTEDTAQVPSALT